MVIKSAVFVKGVIGTNEIFEDGTPQIVFVGRSNVGKSSLINALVRRPVARTSAAPGKTRLANFYRVQRGSAEAVYLVDLPGYGYARGGDAAAQEFNRLTEAYFSREKNIAVLLLIDSRHPGLESDLTAWQWLKSQPCPSGIVATKVDKLTQTQRVRHARALESLFETPALLVSVQDGQGLEELWKLITRLPSQTAA